MVLRCKRGDVAAWRELCAAYERRLLYFIRRLVDSERDAWDVLQQTWMGAMRSLPRLQEPRALRTWLYRIARNAAITHRRRAGLSEVSVDPAELIAVADDNPGDCLAADTAEQIHAALARLSVAHREVLTLHFLEGASVEEIAAVLEVPDGTVKSRLHYAKRALRDLIEQSEQP
jgi:RNA polymerase sigma-70 factor (ECF subfamily)